VLIEKAKKTLLLDAAGAALSACLLGIVLRAYQDLVGIPDHILILLASLALSFFLIDLIFYFLLPSRVSRSLSIIAIVNLSYAALSLGLAIAHAEDLTQFVQ